MQIQWYSNADELVRDRKVCSNTDMLYQITTRMLEKKRIFQAFDDSVYRIS